MDKTSLVPHPNLWDYAFTCSELDGMTAIYAENSEHVKAKCASEGWTNVQVYDMTYSEPLLCP